MFRDKWKRIRSEVIIMGAFISRQPNGLLCRFSTVVDCPTDWNMTEEAYIEMCAEKAREAAREVIKNHLQPFDMVKENYAPKNMSKKEFAKAVREMEKEVKL